MSTGHADLPLHGGRAPRWLAKAGRTDKVAALKRLAQVEHAPPLYAAR
jgi:hypothetical protein